MMAIKLALRNLIGAGLRTWLNVIVLSLAFVVIIWHKGILDGWDRQARTDIIHWEAGGGQYWQQNYNPYDPFTLNDSHLQVSGILKDMVNKGTLTPVLITQGTIYPSGRMQSILVKGIDPRQKILSIPSSQLDTASVTIPAIIGTGMAASARLKTGDFVTLRWRDRNGAFDASEIMIAGVFKTTVPTIDGSQIWIPLNRLQTMMMLPGEATILISEQGTKKLPEVEGWKVKNLDFLLSDMDRIIKSKTAGGMILWGILMLLALLAIFDTQVLAIFRRQKEIGMYVAMGMTKRQVVTLFTVEGAMHAVLATLLGAIYGIPLLALQAIKGISFPMDGSDYGISMAERLYPYYGLKLIIITVLVVMLTTTIVSYWPARKIAKMKPTDALRGKIQ